jgi:acetyl esterase/lipase
VTIPENGGDGRAVVLCPGGGYNHIAKSKEGADWIPFFTSQGIAVIVTKYTLPNGDHERPLGDIRNTFKMVREHAKEWGINPNGIGIMGFSAGGHLASAYTNSETGDLKPAFTILFYPVIRMDNKEHLGMAKKFLGSNVTDEQRKAWSTNRMVNEDTPKTIIITADDDPTIDPVNSTMYYEALKRNHVEASLHIYPKGGHGFGFNKSFPYHERMKTDLTDWLKTLAVPAAGAKKNKLSVIDLHAATAGHAELFPDQLHPNKEGAATIARAIAEYLRK